MKRAVLVATGFVACPCHLPLWLALLSGTAAGDVLAAYQGWVAAALTATFVGGLALAVLWPRREPAGETRMVTEGVVLPLPPGRLSRGVRGLAVSGEDAASEASSG